jgi:hypothetical protein
MIYNTDFEELLFSNSPRGKSNPKCAYSTSKCMPYLHEYQYHRVELRYNPQLQLEISTLLAK